VTAVIDDGEPGDWEVTVFEQDQVNAFALPGKKIGIYTGLLDVAKNQHQLATVVAHEVGHVLAQHGNERMSTQFATSTGLDLVAMLAGSETTTKRTALGLLGLGAQVGVLLPFSRAQETEADVMGLELMARAGFDPGESVDLWRNMIAESEGAPPEFLSTHPSGESRIDVLQRHLPEARNLAERARAAGRSPDCG
jgi:predicted Zn-dependent protease